MTLESIISEMLQQGYDFCIGPHAGKLTGYYAVFYGQMDVEVCSHCSSAVLDWNVCGHGHTPLAAVKNARTLALGQALVQMKPRAFRK